jgi:RimJ/RimL family protein N-acetyltransferase
MLAPLNAHDIAEVMRIERLPGYDALVGRFDADEHSRQLDNASVRYFGLRQVARLLGFLILQELDQPTALLRRIAVDTVERGAGGRLVRGAMDWVFETTPARGLRLDVLPHNGRARRVYAREGFLEDGPDVIEGVPHILMSVARGRWADLRSAERAVRAGVPTGPR